nr:thiamine pyrophosphate-dependent enzyme [Baekduia soli]
MVRPAGGRGGRPGLDLPALDVAATARSYGVPAESVQGPDALRAALEAALAAGDGPRLVEVGVRPGMALV